jgi:hypothetical protein
MQKLSIILFSWLIIFAALSETGGQAAPTLSTNPKVESAKMSMERLCRIEKSEYIVHKWLKRTLDHWQVRRGRFFWYHELGRSKKTSGLSFYDAADPQQL